MVPRSKKEGDSYRGSEVQSAARMTKVQLGSFDCSDNAPKRSSPTDLMRQSCKPPTDACEYLILGERASFLALKVEAPGETATIYESLLPKLRRSYLHLLSYDSVASIFSVTKQ